MNGMHAFDVFTKTDESKDIVKRTVTFLKENLNKPSPGKNFTLTNKNFLWMMENGQSQKALDEFHKAQILYQSDSTYNPFYNAVLREQALNVIAYTLLQEHKNPEAFKTFELMVSAYPESPNAYDGMGDYYEAVGNKQEGLRYSKLAIEKLGRAKDIDPQFANGIRQSAEDKIKRLQ